MINCINCHQQDCTCYKRVVLSHGKHFLLKDIEDRAAAIRHRAWEELTKRGKFDGLSTDQQMGVAIAYLKKLKEIL